MKKAPVLKGEGERLRDLLDLEILDTEAEQIFDDTAKLAASICGTPMALVTFVDANRQWFKAKLGVGEVSETPREISFCGHAIYESPLMVITDAAMDERFRDNPAVAVQSGVRFYAGAVLKTSSGQSVGTLCVVDTVPRQLTEEQRNSLVSLANLLMGHLELKKSNRKLKSVNLALEKAHARQVTMEKITQEVKRLSESYQRALDASALVTLADKSGVIIYANDRFMEAMGYTIEEILGKNHRIFKSDIHSREFYANLWTTVSQGKVWQGEMCNRTKSGQHCWADTTIVPTLDANGRVVQFMAIRSDISDRKRMEHQLIESAKLASLGEMAGGMAHEINNPLAIINGKAAAIGRKIEKGIVDPSVILEDLSKIQFTTSRISKIIQGLRAFARNSDSSEPLLEVSLNETIGDTVELCFEKFRNHGVDISVLCDPALKIPCRPTQIAQVLVNLLNNAFDAVQSLPEKWVKIEAESFGKESCIIRVTDSGTGIPSELAKKIMMPFFTTKETGKGTGLGLSISKGIIEQHGGVLTYESGSEHTQFCIRLPMSVAKSGTQAA